MAVRNYSNTAQDTTLNGSITDVATTATVTAATGWPAAPFTILIENEVILVGARTGTSLSSLTRGYDGTVAASHADTTAVKVVVVAQDFEDAATAIHTDVSAEISTLTEKTTPVSADLLVIEDSAASNAKKKVQIGNLPGGGAFSGAKATRSSTAQTVSNSTVTAVSFDTEEYDEGAYWAIGTPTRFEVPAVGYYLITGGIYFALNSTGVRTIYVRKNGTDIIASNQIENVNGAVDFMNVVTTDYASSATDYYEILCFQSSGGNLDLVANDRNFGSVTQLGT